MTDTDEGNNEKNVEDESSQTEMLPVQNGNNEEGPPHDGSQQESTRDKFLLEMYSQLWQSIQRVEGGMWSFIAAFGAIAVSLIAGFQQQIPLDLASIFGIILSFWGMNLAVTSSRWMNRNIEQVGNLEREFFIEDDYGNIVPEEYVTGTHHLLDISKWDFHDINFVGFLSALVTVVVSTFAAGAHRLSALEIVSVQFLVLLGTSVTLLNFQTSAYALDTFQNKTNSGLDLTNIQKRIRSKWAYPSTAILASVISIIIYIVNRFVTQNELITLNLCSMTGMCIIYTISIYVCCRCNLFPDASDGNIGE